MEPNFVSVFSIQSVITGILRILDFMLKFDIINFPEI